MFSLYDSPFQQTGLLAFTTATVRNRHNYHLPPAHEYKHTLLVRLVPNQYFTMCVGNQHIRSPGTHNMYIPRLPDSIYRCYLITSSLCVSRERAINK